MLLHSIVGALTDYSATALNPPGSLFATYDSTYGNRLFKYVLNGESSTAAIAGGLCAQKLSAAVAANYTVYIPLTAALEKAGGVWMAATPAASYGWVQVQGYHPTIWTYAAIVANDSLKGANGAQHLVADASAGTQPTYKRHAVCLETLTTTNVSIAAKGYVNVGEW